MSGDLPKIEHLPDDRVRLHFAAPILFHDKPMPFATFRSPTVMEVLEHGDPVTWLVDKGAVMRVVDRACLLTWFRMLVTDHDADMIGRQGDLPLGLLIEEVLVDFFERGRKTSPQKSALPSETGFPSPILNG